MKTDSVSVDSGNPFSGYFNFNLVERFEYKLKIAKIKFQTVMWIEQTLVFEVVDYRALNSQFWFAVNSYISLKRPVVFSILHLLKIMNSSSTSDFN